MSNKKQEKFASPWKVFSTHWEKYCDPPGRPSKQAMSLYRQFTKKSFIGLKRQPRVLVLGATPEIRDVLTGLKAEVSIIDLNMEMIMAMTELTKKKNPNEIIVKGNWINMPFASNYYDAVLGDIVLTNVPGPLQVKFLKEVKRVLNPKGYFINKMHVIPNDWQFESFDSILDKYAKVLVHNKINLVELFAYLHNNIYNPKTHIMDINLIRKGLIKYWKKGEYKHPSSKVTKLLNDMWKLFKPMDKKWNPGFEKEVSKQVYQYFKIKNKIILNDCYFHEIDESFPLWVCQVKK